MSVELGRSWLGIFDALLSSFLRLLGHLSQSFLRKRQIKFFIYFFQEKDSFEHLWKTSQKTVTNLELEVSEYKKYLSGGKISILDVSFIPAATHKYHKN